MARDNASSLVELERVATDGIALQSGDDLVSVDEDQELEEPINKLTTDASLGTRPSSLMDEPSKNIKKRAKTVKLERDTSVPRDVYGWFEVTLKGVNVTTQTFDCNIEVHLFWQDYSLPTMLDPDEEDFKLDKSCVPVKMSEIWENRTGHRFERRPKYKYFKETATMYMFWISDCTFAERMELQRFPLDRQFLNMEFNALVSEGNWNWVVKAPEWVPQEWHKSICVRMTSSVTEYNLMSPWVDFSGDQPLVIRLRVERLPGYYFGNIILPNFLIVAACFSCFAVPRTETADRLSVSVTLMLAAVAFRFVVTGMLPSISYLTWMDYYVLIGFVGLVVFIVENGIVGIPSIPANTGQYIDIVCAGVFGVVWIIMHTIVATVLFHDQWGRIPWKVMDQLDKEEDEEDEFEYSSKDEFHGNPPSQHCIDEWEKYKDRPPENWARMYSKEHPALAIDFEKN